MKQYYTNTQQHEVKYNAHLKIHLFVTDFHIISKLHNWNHIDLYCSTLFLRMFECLY